MYSTPWSYSFFMDLIEIAVGDHSDIILRPVQNFPHPFKILGQLFL
jgi:hypothetical protein